MLTTWLVPLALSAAFISGTVSYKQILSIQHDTEITRLNSYTSHLPCYSTKRHGLKKSYSLRLVSVDFLQDKQGYSVTGDQEIVRSLKLNNSWSMSRLCEIIMIKFNQSSILSY